MFVRTKHKIDKSHEFALVVVNSDVAWVCSASVAGHVSLCLPQLHSSIQFLSPTPAGRAFKRKVAFLTTVCLPKL